MNYRQKVGAYINMAELTEAHYQLFRLKI